MNTDSLAHEWIGEGRPTMVFVHGFTQTRESWRPIGMRFARLRRVGLVDLPGHGQSTVSAMDLHHAGRMLAALCGKAIVVGYSMGARVALHAALHPGSDVRGLVLIGAHPGITSAEERSTRRRADEDLAMRIETVGVERFVQEWLDQPMFAGVRTMDHADRLANTDKGLSHALRALGTGTQSTLDEAIASLDIPILLVVGEQDTKFLDLAERIAHVVKRATVVTIGGAGHACHLEQPMATYEVINDWINSLRYPQPKHE